jgi:hypothetical protein
VKNKQTNKQTTESCQLLQRKKTPFVVPLDTVTRVPFNLHPDEGWRDVGQSVVGVALVGLEWSTVTAVVLVIMNVTKITD